MNIESIQTELQRLLKVTQGWQTSTEVSPIERDIALDSVKRLYEQIAFDAAPIAESAPMPQEEIEEESQELEVEVELTYYEGEDTDIDEEQDPEVEQGQEQTETETEDIPDEEPAFELGEVSIISDGNESSGDGTLFDVNEIETRKKSRRSAILSLYNDAPETIAQRYATETKSQTICDNSATGSSINDRYIITQELFAGDMTAFEALQNKMDSMSNFDDCMIYIVENYDWSADSEAARLFISMLEHRFSKSKA